jgi:uncharacterized membrane protein YozB (DUF420 family)
MDAKVVYWTGAWLNFSLLFAYAVLAVRCVKMGDAAMHRRYMITASTLVVLFLLSYVVKLMVLGREDMSVWSARDVNVLRFHETCVLAMVVAGGLTLWLGRRIRRTRSFTKQREDELASAGVLRTHRIAGRVAVIGAALGWLSAGFVLLGMYERTDQQVTGLWPASQPQVVSPLDGCGRTPDGARCSLLDGEAPHRG